MIKPINIYVIGLACFFCIAFKSISKEQLTLIVYGSDACHYCVDTKTFLNKNNIAFIYYDIDIDKVKEKEMLSKLTNAGISIDNFQLPVVDKGGDVFTNGSNFITFLKKLLK